MTLAIKEPDTHQFKLHRNGKPAAKPMHGAPVRRLVTVAFVRQASADSAVLRGRCNYCANADTVRAIMRIITHYKLIADSDRQSVEKEVNEFLKEQGYELYGSPFSCATSFCQALVKYEQARSNQFPTTLQSHA